MGADGFPIRQRHPWNLARSLIPVQPEKSRYDENAADGRAGKLCGRRVAPAQTLTDKEYQIMRNASMAVLREIGVETGGSNVHL